MQRSSPPVYNFHKMLKASKKSIRCSNASNIKMTCFHFQVSPKEPCQRTEEVPNKNTALKEKEKVAFDSLKHNMAPRERSPDMFSDSDLDAYGMCAGVCVCVNVGVCKGTREILGNLTEAIQFLGIFSVALVSPLRMLTNANISGCICLK